jgi:hypothetical protein
MSLHDMKQQSIEHRIIINNAGLVLLWPFLPAFFNELGLTKDEKFISKNDAIRAAWLLEYLVTGQEHNNENDIALNKFLCNILTVSVPKKHLELTYPEIKESEYLLTAVIHHWKSIEHVSIKGFRDSFLKREGELIFEREAVILRVDKYALDILLDQIPWSIAIIQLTWMEKPIIVEWA